MRKIIIYVILVAVLIVNAYGLSMTYFDFNIQNVTVSGNSSINVTLPGNVSIDSAILSLEGIYTANYNESVNSSLSGISGITLIPGTNDFYMTNGSAGSTTIYRVNSTGSIISQNNYNATNLFSAEWVALYGFYGIYAVNADVIYVIDRNSTSVSAKLIKINYTKGTASDNGGLDRWVFAFKEQINVSRDIFVNSGQTRAWITTNSNDNNARIYQLNIENCNNDCKTTLDWTSNSTLLNNNGYYTIKSNDNGVNFFVLTTLSKIYKLNNQFDIIDTYYYKTGFNSTSDHTTLMNNWGMALNSTEFYLTDTYETDEIAKFDFTYPKKVTLKTNATLVFNTSGLLDGKNTSINIDLGDSLENCYKYSTVCQLNIGANQWGKLNISSLSISYTKLLKLNIFDEETKALVSDEMTVTMVSGTYSHNYTFTGGRINITDIPDEYMEINYGGSGYATRAYFVNINTYQVSLDLYTIHNSSSTLVIFSVPDEKGFPLYNGTITVQRYYVDTSLWTDLCMERIDDNGESGIFLVPNDVYYKFIVQKNGVVLGTFGPRKVFSNSIELPVSTIINQLQSLAAQRDSIATSMVWDNATNIITYSFADASGIVTQGCIEVSEKSIFNEITYGPECISGTSGSAILDMSASIHNNSMYTAKGYVMTTTVYSEPITDIIHKQFNLGYEKFGKAGLYLAYLFIGTMFFLGITMSFSIALIYSVLAMAAIQLIGISFFGWAFIVTITIIGMTIAWVNRI